MSAASEKVAGLELRRWRVDASVVAVVAVAFLGPMLLTNNGFVADWTNDLWLASVQEHAISSHLLPTFYLNTGPSGMCSGCGVGVFYPEFMFYGATYYTAIGTLAAILGGNVVAASAVFILLTIAAAYGGTLWLGRQLGVRSWLAHLPALTLVTSAYYITSFYGRGDWNEWTATSMIPLLLASGLRLLRAPRFEFLPAALATVAAITFAGTHNLTLLLGIIFCALVLVGTKLSLGRKLKVDLRRLGQIALLLVCAMAVNAWFLFPDIAYGARTSIAHFGSFTWQQTAPLNSLGMLLNPLRASAAMFRFSVPRLFVQIPDWFLAWALIGAAVVWLRLTWRIRSLILWLGALLVALVVAIVSEGVWNSIPLHGLFQFPYRLDMYISLDIAALVLVVVVSLQRHRQGGKARIAFSAAAGVATAVSLALCAWQMWAPIGYAGIPNRNLALTGVHVLPPTWYAYSDYADGSLPVVQASATVTINPERISGDQATVTVTPPPGATPFVTNIGAGPYAVAINGGIKPIGRTTYGSLVARRTNPRGSGPVSVTLSVPESAPIIAGRIVSIIAIIALCLAAVVALVRPRLRNRVQDQRAPTLVIKPPASPSQDRDEAISRYGRPMGDPGFEPGTSSLSEKRSNRLS